MISKVLSTVGIAFVASLLLVGCDEAHRRPVSLSRRNRKRSPPHPDRPRSNPSRWVVRLKDETRLTEEEKKQLEMAEKLHKATDCGGFDQTCTHKQEVNLYAIKDEKAEKAGTATLTRTNDGRQPGGGLWSKLKKKEAE